MKIINFTAKEILPSLLNKTKTQTIRPAWDNKVIREAERQIKEALKPDGKLNGKVEHTKPPRFKVGEQVKLMWNQKSKYHWFETTTGKGVSLYKDNKSVFHKTIGIVEITEVFEIEMQRFDVLIGGKEQLEGVDVPKYGIYDYFESEYEGLAKRDGFNSPKEMFQWFDFRYELCSPKKFWVYRWRWLDDSKI